MFGGFPVDGSPAGIYTLLDGKLTEFGNSGGAFGDDFLTEMLQVPGRPPCARLQTGGLRSNRNGTNGFQAGQKSDRGGTRQCSFVICAIS